jgi:dinuclear metal center YbgI/SA1388 family protein
MIIGDIYRVLDSISPFELQESWDNSGLILGSINDSFENIYISLDIDSDLIDKIENNSLIITHHPFSFSKIKSFNFDSYQTKILKSLIKKDCKVIAMHTNIDKTHLSKYVVEKVLGYKISSIDDFIIYFDVNKSFDEFYLEVSNRLSLPFKKAVKTKDFIDKAGLVTGSGCSLIPSISAGLFLTGDIKYHDAMEAKSRGIDLIDIGHYESEIFFSEILNNELKIKGLKAIIINSTNPFLY